MTEPAGGRPAGLQAGRQAGRPAGRRAAGRIPGLPPGRAGRLWLRRRLAAAARAVELLDRKLRILRAEQDRLHDLARRTGEDWRAGAATADEWLRRAALLGGRRALRLANDGRLAGVAVEYTTTMGVRYPARVTYVATGAPPPAPEHAALTPARAACRAALAAACAHAAATAAARAVDDEVAATRRRVRAIKNRWLPRLAAALADVELGLEEQEREDGARLRRVTAREPG
jgi:V/A-type H+-transporting ATPase subunit D